MKPQALRRADKDDYKKSARAGQLPVQDISFLCVVSYFKVYPQLFDQEVVEYRVELGGIQD